MVFRDLVHQRPTWLTCATYELDAHDRALLIDVDDFTWVRAVLPLTYYLNGLDARCDRLPRYDEHAGSGSALAATDLVGCWDPAHEQWCVPYRGWPDGSSSRM